MVKLMLRFIPIMDVLVCKIVKSKRHFCLRVTLIWQESRFDVTGFTANRNPTT